MSHENGELVVSLPYDKTLVPVSPANFLFIESGTPLLVTFIFDDESDTYTRWLRTQIAVAERISEIDSEGENVETENKKYQSKATE